MTNKSTRLLAAIMFTDMVGYTALMQEDEQRAKQNRDRHRKILQESIAKHQGKILQYYGDGTLSIFNSAVEAVDCAIQIQLELLTEPKIPLRIGLHIGDIVFDNEGVYGDGVNVASRIEGLAISGSILISGKVFDEVKNQQAFKTVNLGAFDLKNVKKPVEVYAIGNEGLVVPTEKEIKAKPKDKINSLAVLPFVNMSPDKDQDYFCDGITEEIINALTHIESLKVIARTSVFAFKGKYEDVRKIGRKLNVETILEGSLRKEDIKLRITVQLIKVSDGWHLWSERYDREMKNVFDIQDEISLKIVEKLKVNLFGKEKATIVKRHTENMEAYNLYLKGNYFWQMYTIEGYDKAIKYYEQAIKKDPSYALPYSGMASVLWSSSFWGNVPPTEAYPKAKEYIKKALKIDYTLAEAHDTLGLINMEYDLNWKAAEREFKLAIQFKPNSALIHVHYSFLLTVTRRHEEAIAEAKRAQELDPFSSYISGMQGFSFVMAGRYDEAIQELQMALEINPNYLSHIILAFAYRGKSMFEEAIAGAEKAVDLSCGTPMSVTLLATTYYEFGEKAKANKLFESLKKRSRYEYVPPMCYYLIHRVMGDSDQAFEWLDRACNEHDSWFPYFRVSPDVSYRIPDEPRFNALLKKEKFGKY